MGRKNRMKTMRTNKTLGMVYCMAALLALAGCSKESDRSAAQGPESRSAVRFSAEALVESANAGTTYRIMAYSGESGSSKYQLRYTGTYFLQNAEDKELTACKLNDDGGMEKAGEEFGMNGADGALLLVAVSPGVNHDGNGRFAFVPTKKAFRSSSPQLKTIGGYGTVKIGNPLKDRRATVGFKIYKNKNARFRTLEVADLQLHGAGADGEEVTLYPASRQVAVSDTPIDFVLNDVQSTGETDDAGNALYYTATKALNSAIDSVCVAAAIYAPLKETMEHLEVTSGSLYQNGDYLYMTCKLTQDERKDIPIQMSLTAKQGSLELLAQHHYTFKILVSSDYIKAVVDVFDKSGNDWQDGGSGDGTIDMPTYTVTLGEWKIVGNGNDWELEEIENRPIGGNETIDGE